MCQGLTLSTASLVFAFASSFISIYSLDGDCYKDSPSRLLGELRKEDKTGMTPEVCKAICFEKNNFQYAGVQYKYECFCGNNSPPSSKLLPISQCNLPCSGDSSKKCGGAWKMNVYKKKDDIDNALQISLNGNDSF